MSRHGYWLVTLSASPGARVTVTIAEAGITPEQAAKLALSALPVALETERQAR
jgi:hypothetical protein